MDAIQEFSGVAMFIKSLKVIFTKRALLLDIFFGALLSLAITFLNHMHYSNNFNDIEKHPFNLFPNAFLSAYEYYSFEKSHANAKHWRNFLIYKFCSLILNTVFSVLSTMEVAHTVATNHTYMEILKITRQIWKRVAQTFIWKFVSFLAYNLFMSGVYFLSNKKKFYVEVILSVLYILGFVYLAAFGKLASIVSIFGNSCGLKALTKAKDLIRGKRRVAFATSFLSNGFLVAVVFIYLNISEIVHFTHLLLEVVHLICLVLLFTAFLLIMVIHTVLYVAACKAHHEEDVDTISITSFVSCQADIGGPPHEPEA